MNYDKKIIRLVLEHRGSKPQDTLVKIETAYEMILGFMEHFFIFYLMLFVAFVIVVLFWVLSNVVEKFIPKHYFVESSSLKESSINNLLSKDLPYWEDLFYIYIRLKVRKLEMLPFYIVSGSFYLAIFVGCYLIPEMEAVPLPKTKGEIIEQVKFKAKELDPEIKFTRRADLIIDKHVIKCINKGDSFGTIAEKVVKKVVFDIKRKRSCMELFKERILQPSPFPRVPKIPMYPKETNFFIPKYIPKPKFILDKLQQDIKVVCCDPLCAVKIRCGYDVGLVPKKSSSLETVEESLHRYEVRKWVAAVAAAEKDFGDRLKALLSDSCYDTIEFIDDYLPEEDKKILDDFFTKLYHEGSAGRYPSKADCQQAMWLVDILRGKFEKCEQPNADMDIRYKGSIGCLTKEATGDANICGDFVRVNIKTGINIKQDFSVNFFSLGHPKATTQAKLAFIRDLQEAFNCGWTPDKRNFYIWYRIRCHAYLSDGGPPDLKVYSLLGTHLKDPDASARWHTHPKFYSPFTVEVTKCVRAVVESFPDKSRSQQGHILSSYFLWSKKNNNGFLDQSKYPIKTYYQQNGDKLIYPPNKDWGPLPGLEDSTMNKINLRGGTYSVPCGKFAQVFARGTMVELLKSEPFHAIKMTPAEFDKLELLLYKAEAVNKSKFERDSAITNFFISLYNKEEDSDAKDVVVHADDNDAKDVVVHADDNDAKDVVVHADDNDAKDDK